ncbi:hypothetical protein TWF730_010015 [Orbilia blumenaviensis]|uniref:Uncharacterized protein n=1 Tax=Orbilia blumenaviensis TaxID=1796055 RepID=A0AAV9UTQ6_9PEZI
MERNRNATTYIFSTGTRTSRSRTNSHVQYTTQVDNTHGLSRKPSGNVTVFILDAVSSSPGIEILPGTSERNEPRHLDQKTTSTSQVPEPSRRGVAFTGKTIFPSAVTHFRNFFRPARASARPLRAPRPFYPSHPPHPVNLGISIDMDAIGILNGDKSPAQPWVEHSSMPQKIHNIDQAGGTRQTSKPVGIEIIDTAPQPQPLRLVTEMGIGIATPEAFYVESTMLIFQIAMASFLLLASYKIPTLYPIGRTAYYFTRLAYSASVVFALIYGLRVLIEAWSSLTDIMDRIALIADNSKTGHFILPTQQMIRDIYSNYNRESVQLGGIYFMESTVLNVASVILGLRASNMTNKKNIGLKWWVGGL